MSEKLDHMKDQKEKAEQKLRYYQHQEKMLEHRIPELTRKARTHRLCTRGGMLESFRASRSAAFHSKAVCGHFGNPALASR